MFSTANSGGTLPKLAKCLETQTHAGGLQTLKKALANPHKKMVHL